MRQKTLKDKEGNEIVLEFPDSLKEITLGQLLDKIVLEEEKIDIDAGIQDLMMYKEFEEDEEGNPFGQEEFDLAYVPASITAYDNMVKQLSIFLNEEGKEVIEKVDYSELPTLLEELVFEEEVDDIDLPEIVFTSHEICAIDIERISTSLKEDYLNPEEKEKLKHQLRSLKSGKVIIIPAKDVAFASRIITDDIQKQLPKVPEALEEDAQQGLVNVYQELVKQQVTTLEEYKQNYARSRAIARYIKNYEANYYEIAPKLLSHVCVPVSLNYNYDYAEARAEAFKTVDVYTIKQLLAFFLHMNDLSTKDSKLYSKNLKEMLLKS